jgi:hypothetical protein
MGAITNLVTAAGEADVLLTNEGGALGNANAAAQSAAAVAAATASAFALMTPSKTSR